ncbi:MAG: hypothetical protein M3Q75_13575, partial [Gemmatimonadota bacterium]|nr:hypothetical protein [Gemmatimonadota bacterium]
ASSYLDGAKYHGPVSFDERLQIHVYQKGGSSVGFLWGRAEQMLTLTPAEGLSFFDIMGNPIDAKTLSVTDSPIYFMFEGDAKSCQTLLSGVTVGGGEKSD